MVPEISLNHEAGPGPQTIDTTDGKNSTPTSSPDHVAAHMPVQKTTRQWAAWTRQEEELFFAALRQVGKNFEKITSRVQSKNKDQVRHYYYRLVRRMNKLLGPELSLDAKNSKDTIAAMLRWWSLLEKYSCKASKLHLKPRRFKSFIEALENQLLKDRKKNIRKRVFTGEANSSTTHSPVQTQGKLSGQENRAVKMVLIDGQNIQKVGSGKATLVRRNVNSGMNRSNCKRESTPAKTEKKRQKTGLVATSAYKRWEKAAIAGVSLVADAAEHLERVDTDKEIEHLERVDTDKEIEHLERVDTDKEIEHLERVDTDNGIDHLEQVDTDKEIEHLERVETDRDIEQVQEPPGNDGSQHVGKGVHSSPEPPQCVLNENNILNSKKLKLQLFPIDECTRKALEIDNYNPHLELTLSTRKKISSVVEHLNRKWGKSNLLSQELMLFPYWAQKENLVGYQKWTKDSPLCAADIHYLIGNPAVFRLRYGWFSKSEIELATAQALSCANQNGQSLNIYTGKDSNEAEKPSVSFNELATAPTSSSTRVIVTMRDHGDPVSRRENEAVEAMRQVDNTKDRALSSGDWADSLTSISVGDLLSDSMQNMDVNFTELSTPVISNFQQIPFSCDSFDAAIAAHIYKHENKVDLQQGLASHGHSIWDAEETCDAFAFQKRATFCDAVQNPFRNGSPQARRDTTIVNPSTSHKEIVESTDMERLADIDPTSDDLVDELRPIHTSDNSAKDVGGLTDIYWPDSLGPLDLEIPPCRYHNDDLILSDSFGGLSRLIGNSTDSFQSCSFLGLDKKEAAGSTGEARPSVSFSDFKISSEV